MKLKIVRKNLDNMDLELSKILLSSGYVVEKESNFIITQKGRLFLDNLIYEYE